jgi:hypothetical protein
MVHAGVLMHSLPEIIAMNSKPRRGEDAFSRHCSYSGDTEAGVVLHSAKQRSTAFLSPDKAKRFLAAWFGTNSEVVRDNLVESYF